MGPRSPGWSSYPNGGNGREGGEQVAVPHCDPFILIIHSQESHSPTCLPAFLRICIINILILVLFSSLLSALRTGTYILISTVMLMSIARNSLFSAQQDKCDRQGRDVPQQPSVLLHRGQHQERGQGQLRDQLSIRGGVHEADLRQGDEGRFCSGS